MSVDTIFTHTQTQSQSFITHASATNGLGNKFNI